MGEGSLGIFWVHHVPRGRRPFHKMWEIRSVHGRRCKLGWHPHPSAFLGAICWLPRACGLSGWKDRSLQQMSPLSLPFEVRCIGIPGIKYKACVISGTFNLAQPHIHANVVIIRWRIKLCQRFSGECRLLVVQTRLQRRGSILSATKSQI